MILYFFHLFIFNIPKLSKKYHLSYKRKLSKFNSKICLRLKRPPPGFTSDLIVPTSTRALHRLSAPSTPVKTASRT